MNKDLYYKIRKLDDAMAKALDALYDVKKSIDKLEGDKCGTIDNGKLIINGVEYPIQNFKVSWSNNLQDEY